MPKKGETIKTVSFAALVSFVAGVLLLWAGTGLKDRISKNAKVKKYSYILRALGISIPKNCSADKVISLYDQSVKTEKVSGVKRYLYKKDGAVVSYAYPIQGKGLWGTIKGFLAVEPDLCTVKAVSFYELKETPGLGAEIQKSGFTKQFKGKKMMRPCGSGTIILHVKKHGTANKKVEVDGISGATLTSVAVDKIIVHGIQAVAKTRSGHAGAPAGGERQ